MPFFPFLFLFFSSFLPPFTHPLFPPPSEVTYLCTDLYEGMLNFFSFSTDTIGSTRSSFHSFSFLFFALLLQASQPKEWCYENFINFRSMQSADSVREQLARIMRKLSLPLLSTDFESQNYYLNLRRCMAAGLFMQVRAPVYVYVYVYASLSPLHWSTAFISLVFISFQ